MNGLKDFFRLVFGPSIYKKYSSRFNWWVRYNPFLLLFFIYYIVITIVVSAFIKNFYFYLLLTPFLYKALASVHRFFSTTIPIITNAKRASGQTPFFALNVALFLADLVPFTYKVGDEKMDAATLKIHRHQQGAKFIFNIVLLSGISVFAFGLNEIIAETIKQFQLQNMETGGNINFILQLIGALGSLATFGAFILLFFKDKDKQKQIDKLTLLAQTNSERLRISLMPEFKKIGVKDNGFPNLQNIGDTAIVQSIDLEPASGKIVAFPCPFFVFRDEPLKYDVSLGMNDSFALYTLVIKYHDKIGSQYILRISHLQMTLSILR